MSASHLHVHRRRKDLASNRHPIFVNGASEETREQQWTALRELAREHVGGMDWSMNEGLQLALPSLKMDVQLPARDDVPEAVRGKCIHLWYKELSLGEPVRAASEERDTSEKRMFPRECRERRLSYKAALRGTIMAHVDGERPIELRNMRIAQVPVMLQTQNCHLSKMSRKELIAAGEEEMESGGYFIVNGLEKLCRLLIMTRKNYVMALVRPAFSKRGPTFTNYGCTIRCGRPDGSSQTVYLHYTKDGSCCLRVAIRKAEYFIPVVVLLKALVNTTDRAIYDRAVSTPTPAEKDGTTSRLPDTFVSDRIEIMLKMTRKDLGLKHHEQCLSYLGNAFRVVLGVPDAMSDEDAGRRLIEEFIFVHLSGKRGEAQSKFDLLIYMVQKLYALVAGTILEDNPDSPMNQEILLPGHLYLGILKEKLVDYLGGVRALVYRDLRRNKEKVTFSDGGDYLTGCLKRNPVDVSRKMEYFLATGNLQSDTGLDMMQISGYVMVAERLNYMRFITHFRSIHRGAFFSEMKTTTVRKLLPEAWGFLCPVHTPDGAPCGLLNHLALNCKSVISPPDASGLLDMLSSLGMVEPSSIPPRSSLPVLLDGEVVGHIPQEDAPAFSETLRRLKLSAAHPQVPETTEIACILPLRSDEGIGLMPAVLLFTAAARMIRPVYHIEAGATEWVGSFEQVFMEIACQDADKRSDTTHQELAPTQMLSLAASLTPFSDFNQSPRNMYQCQMMKQTMGTPFHTFQYRVDTKVYRIQTPQTPICRNAEYLRHGIDDYAMGTNAVVAVISYTGYDMEDAMIINKSSYERGFGHGSVYTAETIDLDEMGEAGECYYFGNPMSSGGGKDEDGKPKERKRVCPTLDPHGLPYVGQRIEPQQALYCCVSETSGKVEIHKHKKSEMCIVDEVRVLGTAPGGSSKGGKPLRKVSLKLRYNRNPVIGDKFSSRHGQKGTLAQLWPMVNMPFTEDGLTPDVIINPHAFPSRMTIGMLIESMAGKAGATHGQFHEATPFCYDEQNRAVDYFGEQLAKAGYAYYGNETMYSGNSGEVMEASIFIGLVYYQRLRHMVNDKEQVRATGTPQPHPSHAASPTATALPLVPACTRRAATQFLALCRIGAGPVNQLTHQPIKGRKVGGGIRFGEMERDALLAHGASYLLHDRLMRCSDYDKSWLCTTCGDLLAPMSTETTISEVVVEDSAEAGDAEGADESNKRKKRLKRRIVNRCKNPACLASAGKGKVESVAIPFVFKYLVNELAAMNIHVSFGLKQH